MGTPQLTYGARSNAHAGGLVYGNTRGFKSSRACETAAGIDFGIVVSQGSTDDGCVIGGSKPLGVAIRDHGQGMDEDDDGLYVVKSMVSILDKDYIWMTTASTAGAYRAIVYYDTATGAAVVTAAPTAAQKPIGYLAQTLTAAGLIKVFVDTDLAYAADAVAPADPTDVSAAVGDTESVVTWTDPVDTDLDHLEVTTYVTATGLVVSTYIVAATAETVTVTGLTNSTPYTVVVKSVDSTGNISAGDSDTVTPSA